MRLIGHLPAEPAARTFGDYLYVQGIENDIEHDQQAGWGVWIRDEDRIEEATSLLAAYRSAPDKPEYKERAKEAAAMRREEEKSNEAYRKRFRTTSDVFRPMGGYGFGLVTLGLIVVSVIIFLLTYVRESPELLGWLIISNYYNSGLEEVRHGQIWRLVTPVFIHSGILHILFNLLWLRDLGGMIEARLGSIFLILFVLAVAAGSNLGQYIHDGPVFGGMSGVVYGLLGYIWIRGKFDPASGLFLHPTTVTMMLVWAVVCLVGIIPRVANTAHVVGLAMGAAWGYLASRRWR